LAILQVNVRPAARDRRTLRSQRREKGHKLITHADPAALFRSNTTSISQSLAEVKAPLTTPTFIPGTGDLPGNQNQSSAHPLESSVGISSNGSHQITWKLTPLITVGRALVSAVQRLHEAGCENPRLDAQVLLAHVLGKERSWLFAHHDYQLKEDEADSYTELVARRVCREPVAYLIGCKEFYGMEFLVDQRVLIPRPETELLVDLVLGQIQDRQNQPVVVDVGTGSGAIAVSVAVHAPQARVYGLDLSPDALAVARRNGERLAQDNPVTFLQSDLLEALPERADVIVANLPYVTNQEYAELEPDIRDYEPRLALEAGDQGLDAIEQLLAQVKGYLKPDGAVLLEIGSGQSDDVSRLAKTMQPRPSYVGMRRDYSGHIRMVTLEF
jgi:release factor glutamine methyltransferase